MRTKHFLFALVTALCLATAWAQPFDADIRQTADYKQAETWVPVLLRDNAQRYRTNIGLGATWLTNTNVTNFRTEIGLGGSNAPSFNGIGLNNMHSAVSWQSGNAAIQGEVSGVPLLNVWTTGQIRATIGNSSLTLRNGTSLAFDSGTSASQTRTNLGIGAGISTNRTFVADGVTNSVTIFNGVITGWTQQ